jgi:hypothetical protein
LSDYLHVSHKEKLYGYSIALDEGFNLRKRSSGAVGSFLDEIFLWEWVVTEIVFEGIVISLVLTKYQWVDPEVPNTAAKYAGNGCLLMGKTALGEFTMEAPRKVVTPSTSRMAV